MAVSVPDSRPAHVYNVPAASMMSSFKAENFEHIIYFYVYMSTCVRSADPDVLFALDAISRLKQIHLIHVLLDAFVSIFI